ncbi:MAG: response regulator [Candidatus Berkelbacteria bacterium]
MKPETKLLLIVEDEDSVVYALSEKFNLTEGVKVIFASNGVDGLKKALEEKPDLILLDIILPEMDGIEMLEKLREDDWGKNVEVIILSNLSDPDSEKKARTLGVTQYIIKADCEIEDVVKKALASIKT